jgi:hypothetical protein
VELPSKVKEAMRLAVCFLGSRGLSTPWRRTVRRPIPENITDSIQSVGDNPLNGEQSAPDGWTVRRLTSVGNRVAVISAQFQSLNGGQSTPEWRTVHWSFALRSRSADGFGQRPRDQRRTVRASVADCPQFNSLNLTTSFCERWTVRALNGGLSADVIETQ